MHITSGRSSTVIVVCPNLFYIYIHTFDFNRDGLPPVNCKHDEVLLINDCLTNKNKNDRESSTPTIKTNQARDNKYRSIISNFKVVNIVWLQLRKQLCGLVVYAKANKQVVNMVARRRILDLLYTVTTTS